jgi:hypothetical protein
MLVDFGYMQETGHAFHNLAHPPVALLVFLGHKLVFGGDLPDLLDQ